uniref:Evolutionarily conserved signaling intermediate in Toll pathway, mitochondrial n=1 Tax=Timema californicum TaxID=61474 RepID=A0A7R9JG16_TIMCA|nr:unnamed protein product [Timema californicum]
MYIDAILRAKSVRWSQCKLASSAGNNDRSVVVRDLFEQVTDKNKQTYLDMVKIFESRGIHRRGHVEFIYSAMRHMEEFGVEKELQVYKALIDVLPKGRFIPTNIFQAEFMHYPKQQQYILVNIFGRKGHPVRKYWRMMYWMPKFKNISPWPLPRPIPQDSQLLARLALSRMSSVDLQTSVCTYQTSAHADSLDDTWVVSAQSPLQRKLLDAHPHNVPVYVEGAFLVWLREAPEGAGEYVPPTVHEQDDGTILAMCATGTSSRDSLLSWVRLLERDGNPALGHLPVLFKLRSPLGELATLEEDQTRIQAPGFCETQSTLCDHSSSIRIALRDVVFGTSVSANTTNTLAPFILSSEHNSVGLWWETARDRLIVCVDVAVIEMLEYVQSCFEDVTITVGLPTPVVASRAARDRNTAAAGESGSSATQLCPFSPHAPTRESSGKHPRKGTPDSSARELPPPLEKILVHSCKQQEDDTCQFRTLWSENSNHAR